MTDEIPMKVEIKVGDDWEDITCRALRTAGVRITRGRSNEMSAATPSSAELTLRNHDGALTPRNPESPWWPHIDRGLPIRVRLDEPTRSALMMSGHPGGSARTPDHSSLDITGDIDIRFEGRIEWGAATGTVLTGKWRLDGDQRSWLFAVTRHRLLELNWTTDGTAATQQRIRSTEPLPWTGYCAGAVRVALDVDDSGDHTATFWVAETMDGPWTQLGDPVTEPGTTSIFAGSSPMGVGSGDGFGASIGSYSLSGLIYRAEVRDGIEGTVVAAPDFTVVEPGTTSFTDSAGRTWTIGARGEIIDRRVRFTGRVDEFEVRWPVSTGRDDPDPGASHVRITAAGPLRRMQQGAPVLESTLFRHITAPTQTGIVAYWPFEDGRDAKQISSPLPGVTPMKIGGTFDLAADNTLNASKALMRVQSGRDCYMQAPIPTIPQVPGVRWEVTRFIRIDEPVANPASTQLLAVDTNGRVATWRVSINNIGVFVSGRDVDGAPVVSTNFPVDDRFFGTWAHIVLEVADDDTEVNWAVWIIPIPLGIVTGTSGTFTGHTGIPRAFRNRLVGPPQGISVGHLIVSTGKTVGWLAGADTAWEEETAARRFWRLCEEEGIPSRLIGDPTAWRFFRGDPLWSQPMGPQRQAPLVDLLAECAHVDGGILYEDTTGRVVFRTRMSMQNQEPAVVLEGGDRSITRAFQPVLDDQRLVTDIVVPRPDGSSAYLSVDDRPAGGGKWESTVEVNVFRDAQLPSQAGMRLRRANWPEMRIPSFGTNLRTTTPQVRARWYEAEIGDRVELRNLPRQAPHTVGVIIEGWTERLDGIDHRIEPVNASPAGPWEVGVRDDNTRGKRDTAGSELAVAVDEDDVNLVVTTTVGPNWTTDPDDLPLDLDVGGEQVRATDVTPFGTAVIFTVERARNGVRKAHPIGTPVRLWRPAVRDM